MPKRKRHSDDYDHLNRKIRKLQRKLDRKKRSHSRSRSRRRNRRSRRSSSYSDSESSSREATRSRSPPPRNRADEYEYEHSAVRSPSPVDDVILDDLPTIENRPVTDESLNCNVINEPNSQQNEVTPQETVPPPAEKLLDTELLEILGDDPSSKPEFGNELHKELASRLEHTTTSGLSKESRKALFDKYLIPSNCTRIAAPQLNPEIKAALPELTLKRDKGMEARQKQLASAITCLGQAITAEMQSKEKNNLLLKQLMDAIRMLCDIQHVDSMKRRYFACSSLKKDINEQLVPTKVDKFLFGENLAETLKAAKAVSKSGAEIKVDANSANKNFKKPAQPQQSTSKNWRPPPPARRPPTTGTPRNRQPAPARKHEISSRVSRPHSKQTRRH